MGTGASTALGTRREAQRSRATCHRYGRPWSWRWPAGVRARGPARAIEASSNGRGQVGEGARADLDVGVHHGDQRRARALQTGVDGMRVGVVRHRTPAERGVRAVELPRQARVERRVDDEDGSIGPVRREQLERTGEERGGAVVHDHHLERGNGHARAWHARRRAGGALIGRPPAGRPAGVRCGVSQPIRGRRAPRTTAVPSTPPPSTPRSRRTLRSSPSTAGRGGARRRQRPWVRPHRRARGPRAARPGARRAGRHLVRRRDRRALRARARPRAPARRRGAHAAPRRPAAHRRPWRAAWGPVRG